MAKVKQWAMDSAETEVDSILLQYKNGSITRGDAFDMIKNVDGLQLIGIEDEDIIGDVIYEYEVENNINNREENEDLLISSPTDLLDFYQKDDFIYAFYDELVVDGRIITMIDFKPVDDEQEFFKIRLSVDKKQNLPAGAKLFYRDGTRIEVVFKQVSNQSQFSDSDFVLTKEDVDSGVEFIDLRY